MNSHLDRYFYELAGECPYGKPYTAIYRQAQFSRLPPKLLDDFLAAGYRRNGGYLYRMVCPQCRECWPIRILPQFFRPNRNQRRVARANSDLNMTVGPLDPSPEKLALADKFLLSRYPGRGNSARDYYSGFFLNSISDTFEVEYRLAGILLGVAVVDLGAETLNCVYFYFDPEMEKRSPGIFNILHLLDFARVHALGMVYLGYWIENLSAMHYKAYFHPHQLLREGEWVEVGK